MSIFIAVANLKGGVGKSTSTLMAAEGLAFLHRRRVLVIDFDPQAMVSQMLVGMPHVDLALRQRGTLLNFFLDRLQGEKRPMHQYTIAGASDLRELRVAYGESALDLVPMHPQAVTTFGRLEKDIKIAGVRASLDDILTPVFSEERQFLSQKYDVVLLDCAAGSSPLARVALRESDLVLVPSVMEKNSLASLGHFVKFMLDEELALYNKLRSAIYILPTLFVRSNPAQQMLFAEITRNSGQYNAAPFYISHSTAIQRAGLNLGDGTLRLSREKYNSSYEEFERLAGWMNSIVSSHLSARGAARAQSTAPPAAANDGDRPRNSPFMHRRSKSL